MHLRDLLEKRESEKLRRFEENQPRFKQSHSRIKILTLSFTLLTDRIPLTKTRNELRLDFASRETRFAIFSQPSTFSFPLLPPLSLPSLAMASSPPAHDPDVDMMEADQVGGGGVRSSSPPLDFPSSSVAGTPRAAALRAPTTGMSSPLRGLGVSRSSASESR